MASRGCQSFLNLFGNSFTLLCNRLHHYIHLCDSVCSYYQKWYHMKLIKENKVNIVHNWNKLNDFIIKWKNTFFLKYVFFGEIWSFKKVQHKNISPDYQKRSFYCLEICVQPKFFVVRIYFTSLTLFSTKKSQKCAYSLQY